MPQAIIKCPVCDSASTSRWSERLWPMPGEQGGFYYRRCSGCGTVFCEPLPTVQQLDAYYRNHFNYGWYQQHLALKKIQAGQRWRRVASLLRRHRIPRGQLLDIGCGHGLFLASARRAKWAAAGVDYPSLATRYAQDKLGLTVAEGDLRTVIAEKKIKASQFDLVTAWHCLEHDTDPLSFMEGIKTVLAPGGKVLVAVPNAGALGMKLMGENWVWCQQPYLHVFHFTEKSLSLLARRAGLNVLAAWTRDTWDAQPFYDAYAAAHKMRWLKGLGRRRAFWLDEGMRLGSYAATCGNHWLMGRERADGLGSELLLLADKGTTKAK